MRVTNRELFGAIGSLSVLTRMTLPVATALQVVKLVRTLKGPVDDLETVRVGLCNQYGSPQEDGEIAVIGAEDTLGREATPNWEKFVVELDKLLDVEIEVDVERVVLPTEVDGEPFRVEPSFLLGIERFVTA